MAEKGFNLFDECASRCVDMSLRKKSATSFSWGDNKMYKSGSLVSSRRMLTEINERGTIAKKWMSVESDTVKHLKTFRIISSEMPISLLVLSI